MFQIQYFIKACVLTAALIRILYLDPCQTFFTLIFHNLLTCMLTCFFDLLGLPGLVQAYQTCIQSVQLYGPTNISPIINHVAHFAMQAAQTPAASVSCNNLLCPSTSKGFFHPCQAFEQALPGRKGQEPSGCG